MKRVDGISKLFDIKNRNIVITGSSGLLGSQYANTLSAAGANVILVDLDSAKNKKLENSLIKKYGTRARSYTTDISNIQEVKKLAKNVFFPSTQDIVCHKFCQTNNKILQTSQILRLKIIHNESGPQRSTYHVKLYPVLH